MTGARVLFLSHTHVFGDFRVGSHHYARELAHLGADVVHLSTPISLAHRLTGRIPRAVSTAVPRHANRDDDGVTHLVPRTNLPRPWGTFRVARTLTRAGIEPRFDAVLIDQPLLWDDSVRRLAPRLVYRPTDLYPDGTKADLQARIVADADGVVATSTEVLRALGALSAPSLVLTNGVDAARFAPDEGATARARRAVYVGALDARFDWPRVVAWANEHPDVTFAIAGPAATPPTMLPHNIEVLGPVPYADLPALLHGARVGLLPLSDDPLNTGRSPMKLYEYLAAGLAVVARGTPVLRSEESAGVFTYAASENADAVLDRALTHPSPNVAGRARAARESWDAKAAALLRFVDSLPAR